MDEDDLNIIAQTIDHPRPHVVILGAGASRAAFPQGDAHGRMLPLLNDLVGAVGLGAEWSKLLKLANPPLGSFEEQYSWCKSSGRFAAELTAIEERIIRYFSALELPPTPTVYDHLVLGLRPQDVIASFNWDPLLMLAHRRNRVVVPLPNIRFLHGCVALATCPEHDVVGIPGEACPHCKTLLERSRLIFPVRDKDYGAHAAIHRDWQAVGARLKQAFHLTIFGYSGPATDLSARRLLLDGWTATPFRDVSHVEMIDISDETELRARWAEFIPYHHSMIIQDFFESSVAQYPRRTADWKIRASLYGLPSKAHGPFRAITLAELQDQFRALAALEKRGH